MSVPDTDNRRQSPRRQARNEICLQANLSLLEAGTEIGQEQAEPLLIFGNTRDLSETGVSLIIPLISIDEQYCREEGNMLPVRLYLPNGEVKMKVAPVRCIPLDKDEPGKGFFIAAQITDMEKGERTRFVEYLRTIST